LDRTVAGLPAGGICSIRDDNPVLFLEHKRLYSMKEEIQAPAEEMATLGQAGVVRAGAAAELVAESGIDVEMVDLRTVRPLDQP
jgi:pyruvate/2-oxoglutarate/acetoin dehydrogenase E1 component